MLNKGDAIGETNNVEARVDEVVVRLKGMFALYLKEKIIFQLFNT